MKASPRSGPGPGAQQEPDSGRAGAVRVDTLMHRDAAVARQIHAVLQRAYAQEASLLGLSDFAPLARTAADIQAEAAVYLGAWRGDTLLGSISIERDDAPGQLCIAVLSVDPDWQRQGVARALLRQALRLGDGMVFVVATAAANIPALALYRGEGFEVYRHGSVGPGALALVGLRRSPSPRADPP